MGGGEAACSEVERSGHGYGRATEGAGVVVGWEAAKLHAAK